MGTYTFEDYQKAVSAAEENKSRTKIGWFKLEDDGDTAIVRFNISSISDIAFATIHQLGANTNWMRVNCLNEIGSINNTCPLCVASNQNTNIGKAQKRIFIPMLVSYRDSTTGQWSAPQPVVWNRPASYSRELVNKINDAGDLRNVLMKITRIGAKKSQNTIYTTEFALPTVYAPEMIPADFSAFDGFRYDKHSFWVKSREEIEIFIQTGTFPAAIPPSDEQDPTFYQSSASTVIPNAPGTIPQTPIQAPQQVPTGIPQYTPPTATVPPVTANPQFTNVPVTPNNVGAPSSDPTTKFAKFSF